MFKEDYNGENLLSFSGPLTVSLVSFMANYLKSMLNADYVQVKRIFRIFIELTQNISYYSAEILRVEDGVNSGVGWFMVNESDNCFTITTGNLIYNSDGIKLRKNCDEINLLDEKQLRELKRKTRGQAMIRDVGAHIGLIQTSILSKSKLNYRINQLNNEHSFFVISVNIDK